MGSFPQIADWNEDGKKDLLVGDTNGKLTLFINVGENDAPVLEDRGVIKEDSDDLAIGARLCVEIVDWNNDGKKDLIAGTDRGKVYFIKNIGTNEEPVFSSTDRYSLMVGTSFIYHLYTSPQVYDMNNDGKKDLIVGTLGGYRHGLYLYKNVGTDSEPVFETAEKLLSDENDFESKMFLRFDICDWNEDGYPDIVMGESEGYITVYLNKGPSTPVEDPTLPGSFSLLQNYPNPFNPVTTIKFRTVHPANVNLTIYNSKGQYVKKLVSTYLPGGEYRFKWDGRNETGKNVASGVYFYRLDAGEIKMTRKMILIR